jgi:glycosyltransferase involved in cell wall biosynthesis
VVGPPFNEAEAQRIVQLGLSGRIENYGPVSDPQLAALYRDCIAFVYPSLYEGFGIPLLEAMQCGAPIIATNSASIPEVVDDAALLVGAGQEGELTNALLRLARESALRSSLIEKGFLRARQFSWDTTARRTLEVYERLAQLVKREPR